jgi:D-glycero-D-manno-heptose 1,7-bisphosphate phosphatase
MLLAAAETYNLNLSRSVLVGDKRTDVEAGAAAGVGYNVLLSSDPQPRQEGPPDVIVMESLASVTSWLSKL